MGHETLGGEDACGQCRWGLRWSSRWSHETLYWVGETHADAATGAFGGTSHAPGNAVLAWRRRIRTVPLGPSVDFPMGPSKAALACKIETHANGATEAFGGAPSGATKRSTGWGRRMRTLPLGPSVELPMGPRSALRGGGDARGRCHWGLK
eukprot:996189-Pyramimonas_sp.AAC.1